MRLEQQTCIMKLLRCKDAIHTQIAQHVHMAELLKLWYYIASYITYKEKNNHSTTPPQEMSALAKHNPTMCHQEKKVNFSHGSVGGSTKFLFDACLCPI